VLFALAASASQAAESVTIDISGLRIQNGLAQSRTSGTQTINAAQRYASHISSNTTASGSGGILGVRYPSPTPLTTIFNDLAPGTNPLAPQTTVNSPGTLPLTFTPQVINQTSTISGINVTFGMTVSTNISATGVCSFSFSNVVVSPSILVGSLVINQGSVIVDALCLADLTLDRAVTIDDLLLFLTYFETGDVQGDMNGDNAITIDDLLSMLGHFEGGC
jgi:LysM repeat protein